MPTGPVTPYSALSRSFLVDDEPRITEALRRAVRTALHEHARLGNPVATWRDGVVEIEVTPEPSASVPRNEFVATNHAESSDPERTPRR